MSPENLLEEWARVLLTSLADAGVEDVVVSPGSRSTPLVCAALSIDRLVCHSVVDERAAAFFALGRAKVTGIPSALVCTSGSAVAHYFPAIVEASLAAVPLIVVTADRPFELQDAGAPQTIDQIRFYGHHVRRFVELGLPDGTDQSLQSLRRVAARAVFDATSGEPGPVHLNFRARKPLEPVPPKSDAAKALVRRVDGLLASPIPRPVRANRTMPDSAIGELASACARAERGLVVCGPLPVGAERSMPAVAALLERTGFGVYAEATSQFRFAAASAFPEASLLDGLDVLLRSPTFRAQFEPDLILQIGAAPVSSAWERFVLEHPSVPRYVVAEQGYPDPQSTARMLLLGDLGDTLERLAGAVRRLRAEPGRQASPQQKNWNLAAWAAVEKTIAGMGELSEGAAVRAVVGALRSPAILGIGNSLPVRHVDAFCRSSGAGLSVLSQRGASGIDGLVAGAAGAADASGRPMCLLLGDVSLLHDLGGFDAASKVRTPLVVVVLNNDGGRIFENLPLAESNVDAAHLRFWTTPHGRSFEGLAPLFGVGYTRATSIDAVRNAVLSGLAKPGCSVVEVPLSPSVARDEYRALESAVEAGVRALGV